MCACGTLFTPTHKNQMRCSVECRREARLTAQREYHKLRYYADESYRTHCLSKREPAARSKASRIAFKLRKHGMSVDAYKAMWERQNGVCAICKQPEVAVSKAGQVKELALDHCHITLRVRGLLCTGCNTGLGSFRDDSTRLSSAIAYLQAAA